MRKIKLCVLFLLKIHFCFAQNLVPNYGFENYWPQCPNNPGQLERAIPWKITNSNLFQFNNRSADYYNTCSMNPYFTIPSSHFPNINAFNGNGMVGIGIGSQILSGGPKEYLEVELISTLKNGKEYNISIKVKHSLNCSEYGGSFGVLFLDSLIENDTGFSTPLPFNPQCILTDSITGDSLVNNDSIWHTLSARYLAKGDERVVIIGNFENNQNMNLTFIQQSSQYPTSYYFIDNVRVVEDTLTANNIVELENTYIKSKLLKIVDLLGRETKEKKNTLLFYIYDNGTV